MVWLIGAVVCLHLFTIKIYCQKFIIITLLRTIKSMVITPEIKNNLHLSSVNLYYGSKAISFKGCNLWNQLPEDIKNIKNTIRFKRKLRELFHNRMSLC